MKFAGVVALFALGAVGCTGLKIVDSGPIPTCPKATPCKCPGVVLMPEPDDPARTLAAECKAKPSLAECQDWHVLLKASSVSSKNLRAAFKSQQDNIKKSGVQITVPVN